MAFWADDEWVKASQTHKYVGNFDKGRLSDGAYKLCLGSEAIVSSGYTEQGSENAYRALALGGELKLLPGQFAYLITEETVSLTTNVIGFINVATGQKLKGLVNISGFHVDPGYQGKLIFTVFNAGPTPLSIFRGQPLFRFWLSDFRGSGSSVKSGHSSIPRDWADRLHGTYPSPFALSARVSELERQVGELRGQKAQFLVYVFIIGIFLFPFVASLYASVFAPWFGVTVTERVLESFFKRTPTSGLPIPEIPAANTGGSEIKPPAANTSSTDERQVVPAQPR